VHVTERQKLNEVLKAEKEHLVNRKRRIEKILERQQNAALGRTAVGAASEGDDAFATSGNVSSFASQAKRDFQDPRSFSKDINGNFVKQSATQNRRQQRMNIGANHNNQSSDDSFHQMRDTLVQNADRTYKTHKPVDEDQEQLLFEGVSREGEGRRKYLQERGKMMPQERFNEPQTAAQEVGWFATNRNPYTKFDSNAFNRRKYRV